MSLQIRAILPSSNRGSAVSEISSVHIPSRLSALPLRRRLICPRLNLSSQSYTSRGHGIFMSPRSTGVRSSDIEANTSVVYSNVDSDQCKEDPLSGINVEPVANEVLVTPVNDATKQKKAAKIHDFCFGIPFGGIIFGGGILAFLLSQNITVLSTGVLFGGAILALSTCSLKVWRQGKSSFPFILGQAALAAVLAVKNFQAYSLAKKLVPSGFYAMFSVAMLCFYSYVMLSGGNPPPKKLKATASSASS